MYFESEADASNFTAAISASLIEVGPCSLCLLALSQSNLMAFASHSPVVAD